MRRSWIGLSVASVLVLLLSACGSDGDALSDREYFEALGEVAAAAEAQDQALDAAFPFGDTPPDAETLTAVLDRFQAIFSDARAGFAGLATPPDLAVAHNEMVAAQDAVIGEFERARGVVETVADLQTFFAEASPAFDEFTRACLNLEQLAADRGIVVELFCPEE